MKPPRNSKQNSAIDSGKAVVSSQSCWAGPLPPPAALEHFERIVPGSAARLIEMADAEQKHRHTIESGQMSLNQEGVRLAARDSLTGMLLGALVALSGMAGAAWMYLAHAPWLLSAAFLSLPIMIVAVELARRKH